VKFHYRGHKISLLDSWVTRIQFPYSHPPSLRFVLLLSSHLCLCLPRGLFPSGFLTFFCELIKMVKYEQILVGLKHWSSSIDIYVPLCRNNGLRLKTSHIWIESILNWYNEASTVPQQIYEINCKLSVFPILSKGTNINVPYSTN